MQRLLTTETVYKIMCLRRRLPVRKHVCEQTVKCVRLKNLTKQHFNSPERKKKRTNIQESDHMCQTNILYFLLRHLEVLYIGQKKLPF